MMKTISFLILACSPCLSAQKPTISSIINYGSVDTRFAPGSFARLAGWNLSPEYGRPEVTVGGRKAIYRGLLSGDDGFNLHFDFEIPLDQPLGPTTVIVTTPKGVSEPDSITVERVAPIFIYPTLSRSAQSIEPIWFLNGCAVRDAPEPGELLYAHVNGLGNGGDKPELLIGGIPVEIVSVLPPQNGFSHRLAFHVPQLLGMQTVMLRVAGQSSSPFTIPIGKATTLANPIFPSVSAPERISSAGSCSGIPFDSAKTEVRILDAFGIERKAEIVSATPGHLEYITPKGTALGVGELTVLFAGSLVGNAPIEVRRAVPETMGSRFFSASVVRVHEGIARVESKLQLCRNGWWCLSVDMGEPADTVYFVYYTTGARNASSARAWIGDVEAPVEYVGPQAEWPGVDQVNIRVPHSLAGRGLLPISLVLDGVPDNAFQFDTFAQVELR